MPIADALDRSLLDLLQGCPRSVQKPESSISCRVPVVVAEQSAKPLAAAHLPFLRRAEPGLDDFITFIGAV